MNGLYVMAGVCVTIFGVYTVISENKRNKNGKEDKLGFGAGVFQSGIMFIILGILLIVKYL